MWENGTLPGFMLLKVSLLNNQLSHLSVVCSCSICINKMQPVVDFIMIIWRIDREIWNTEMINVVHKMKVLILPTQIQISLAYHKKPSNHDGSCFLAEYYGLSMAPM